MLCQDMILQFMQTKLLVSRVGAKNMARCCLLLAKIRSDPQFFHIPASSINSLSRSYYNQCRLSHLEINVQTRASGTQASLFFSACYCCLHTVAMLIIRASPMDKLEDFHSTIHFVEYCWWWIIDVIYHIIGSVAVVIF
jgi:hypothetical protein